MNIDKITNDFTEKKMKKFCVVGANVQHSLSPLIHQYIFDRDEIYASYEIVDIPKGELTPDRFSELIKTFRGVNVTTPHKTVVADFLKGNLDSVSEITGSVNTVDIHPVDGVRGYDTDVLGIRQGILDISAAQTLLPSRLILLGGGGVARSVLYSYIEQYERYHMMKIPVIVVFLRDPEKNRGLVNLMSSLPFKGLKVRLQFAKWDNDRISEALNRGGLIINATPLGSLTHEIKTSFDFQKNKIGMGRRIIAADLVYNPAETMFLKTARQVGTRVIGGLGMLVYQAIRSLEIWQDRRISEKGIFDRLKQEGYEWIR